MTIQIKLPSKDVHPDLSVEQIITHLVPNKLQKMDKQLYATKWWDYRFCSPYEATLTYIDTFGKQARMLYARDLDSEVAQYIRVVNSKSAVEAFLSNEQKAKRAFSGFWRGRQVADAIGMPYDVYIYQAMSQRLRRWQRPYLPAADQIYQDTIVEKVMEHWNDLKASRIYYSDHYAYLAQNYRGALIQKQYYEYLVECARQTRDPVMTLVDMVNSDRISMEYLFDEQPEFRDKVKASLS